MKLLYYEIETKHKPQEFSDKNIFDFWSVFCFETPYTYEKDGKLVEGEAGDLLIMQPGELVYHGPQKNDRVGFVNDWLYLHGDDFGKLLQRFPLPLNTPFSINKKQFLRPYLQRMDYEQRHAKVGYETVIECILTEAVIEMHREYKKATVPQTARRRMENARRQILRHFKKQWSLDEMAQLCDYSPSRFSALYKQFFDTSPKRDLIETRLHAARKMLVYTGYSVGEIAAECGFGSIHYFSKYFKKYYGEAPLDFRHNPDSADILLTEGDTIGCGAQNKTAKLFESLPNE